MPNGVLGAGNFIVDFVKTIERYPTEQTLANIVSEANGAGGAPYNVLKDLTALGVDFPLAAIGRVGDDDLGKSVLEDCHSQGIDTRFLRMTPGVPTSYTIVMSAQGTGRRTFFHQSGANARLTPSDFDFGPFKGWHLHYGYLLLLDGMDAPDPEFGTGAARMLHEAKQYGLTTSVDLVSEDSDRFQSVVRAPLRYADVAFMNEFELARTTNIEILVDGLVHKGRIAEARRVLDFSGTLVVHWQEGAAVASEDEVVTGGGVNLPPSELASLAGCGDAFAAGFLLAHGDRKSVV